MINGLYSSAAGMLGQLEQQDAITNNLANANTPGYKKSSVSFAAVSQRVTIEEITRAEAPSRKVPCVIPIPFSNTDRSQGIMQDTANPTNLAIDGPGYFVVSDGRSQELTRRGNFTLNNSGQLSTTDGKLVIGNNGPIRISNANWSVDPDGTVKVNGNTIDKLKIISENQTRAANVSNGQQPAGRILQGQLENSNVSVVREMVSMLTALRSYEANQKSIQSIDQTLDKIINIGGRTS